MTQTPSPLPTLITGGTGKTGRRVAAGLDALGLPVRIGSRRADIPFDWDDDGTWGPALEGVGAAYITYAPDLAFPGAAEIIGSFSRQAVAAGVQRLVLLSGRGEDGRRPRRGVRQGRGRRVDDRALRGVRPELRRGLLRRIGAGRGAGAQRR